MKKNEQKYDFQQKLCTVHEPCLREYPGKVREDIFLLPDDAVISIQKNACEVIRTAVYDFVDFLKVSMDICASVTESESTAHIKISLAEESGVTLQEANGYRGFMVETTAEYISIYGHDARGVAQGLFYLEDIMTFNKEPFVPFGKVYKKPIFSPQMVHSSYGLDEYPDEYLSRIAHEGRDTILVFTKGVNQTPNGYLDFNNLICRAARHGLDVYAYSYIISEMSPLSEEAEEYYENSYGRLFRECPDLRGVVLVGESVEFPSKDPHIAVGRGNQAMVDGIPVGKNTSGWWPCEDYPVWLELVKRIIRQYQPQADIVFWTYNWGSRPKEYRIKLIESLPTDISLQATFEMYEPIRYGEAQGHCSDYSLAFSGPGQYFKSEAEAAKKRGIRLYSMTNTGGLTWDFGVIPYEPMPYQWIRRYEAMYQAQKDWDLCGIMESHHYGFYPSFISKLSKWAFWEPQEDITTILKKIVISTFGELYYHEIDRALRLFSEAITYFTPNDSDQYGAFRVGPSYPFNLERVIKIPSHPDAMFGNSICYPIYMQEVHPLDSLPSIRIPEELKSLTIMLEKMEKGLQILSDIPKPNEKLEELINLIHFICCSIVTGIHAKEWQLLKNRLNLENDRKELKIILDKMEFLLHEELDNTKKAIPLVQKDSRLGWEPSMLYMTDKWHLEWKIRQVNYVLKYELEGYRQSLKL